MLAAGNRAPRPNLTAGRHAAYGVGNVLHALVSPRRSHIFSKTRTPDTCAPRSVGWNAPAMFPFALAFATPTNHGSLEQYPWPENSPDGTGTSVQPSDRAAWTTWVFRSLASPSSQCHVLAFMPVTPEFVAVQRVPLLP